MYFFHNPESIVMEEEGFLACKIVAILVCFTFAFAITKFKADEKIGFVIDAK